MKIKPFSDDLYGIMNFAGNLAKKYNQTFCGTAHLFLSMFSYLSKNKETEKYKPIYDGLKDILNKYGVDGKTFEASFLSFCPKGEAPTEGSGYSITADTEYKKVSENLNRTVMELKRSMEVEDLLMELFTDRAYMIYTIFSDIIKSDNKTDEMYDEIIKRFKKTVQKEIKELEEMPELTNLNKWIQKNPQTVIGADENVKKIEMALAGRSIRNCVLTGKAGTGKTSFVYEFVQRIVNGNVPEEFKDKVVYQMDPSALVAGTKFRGIHVASYRK